MSSLPRFAVLFHSCPGGLPRPDHWDLLFERGAALRTYAIAFVPAAGAESVAEALADHRLEYLDYEGPISGERGSVSRWDFGHFETLEDSDKVFRVRLHGRLLRNIEIAFRAQADQAGQADQRWSVRFSAGDSSSAAGISSA